jgi:hypothetical protein
MGQLCYVLIPKAFAKTFKTAWERTSSCLKDHPKYSYVLCESSSEEELWREFVTKCIQKSATATAREIDSSEDPSDFVCFPIREDEREKMNEAFREVAGSNAGTLAVADADEFEGDLIRFLEQKEKKKKKKNGNGSTDDVQGRVMVKEACPPGKYVRSDEGKCLWPPELKRVSDCLPGVNKYAKSSKDVPEYPFEAMTDLASQDCQYPFKYTSDEVMVEGTNSEEFLGDLMVEVHVIDVNGKESNAHVDLAGHRKPNTPRNFTFQKMPWREMIQRIRKGEKLYMRHTNGSKKAANVYNDFQDPETKRNPFDTRLFHKRCGHSKNLFHSSVLRVSSPGTTLWMHFDTRDNCLHQLSGRKRVILYGPQCEPYLNVEGSSARLKYMRGVENFDETILNELDTEEIRRYECFESIRLEHAHVCTLEPGDALWIPAFWFHRVTSLPSETNEPSVAVNEFFNDADLEAQDYDAKDVYGNKDLVKGKKALQNASEIGAMLSTLPSQYQEFYARRCLNEIAAQLGMHLHVPPLRSGHSEHGIGEEAIKAFED